MMIFGWSDSLYGRAHVQTHLNAVPSVKRDGIRKTRHAVITVAQDFNPQTAVLLQRARGKELSTWTQEKHRQQRWRRSSLTLAMSSKRPKSLLRTATSSSGVQVLDRCVKPTISAYRILQAEMIPLLNYNRCLWGAELWVCACVWLCVSSHLTSLCCRT